MYEDASRPAANFFSEMSHILAELTDVRPRWVTLLAFDHDRRAVSIDEKHVKARAVFEHVFTEALVWIRK